MLGSGRYMYWASNIYHVGSTMPLHIEDKAATDAVRRLARVRSLTLTEAGVACEEVLSRDDRSRPVAERLQDIHQRLRSFAPTGLKADKAFFDREWDDE